MGLSQGLKHTTLFQCMQCFPTIIQGEMHMKFIISATNFSACIAEYHQVQHAAKFLLATANMKG